MARPVGLCTGQWKGDTRRPGKEFEEEGVRPVAEVVMLLAMAVLIVVFVTL